MSAPSEAARATRESVLVVPARGERELVRVKVIPGGNRNKKTPERRGIAMKTQHKARLRLARGRFDGG